MKARNRGVSLLEVLVALVILAASATVLFEWVLQLNTRLRALNERQQQTLAQMQAIEFLNSVNPTLRASGSQAFGGADGGFVLRWDSKAATPYRRMLLPDGTNGTMAVAVFDVNVLLSKPSAGAMTEWLRFDTRLAGFRPSVAGNTPGFGGDVQPGEATTSPEQFSDDDGTLEYAPAGEVWRRRR
jgi:prepilin-type N-terminal cleavage/methylation domain-containing protein